MIGALEGGRGAWDFDVVNRFQDDSEDGLMLIALEHPSHVHPSGNSSDPISITISLNPTAEQR